MAAAARPPAPQPDRQGPGSVPCFPWLLLFSQSGMTAPVRPSFCVQHLARQWSHIHTSVPSWGCHCSRRCWHLGSTWHPQAHVHTHTSTSTCNRTNPCTHPHTHTYPCAHTHGCTHPCMPGCTDVCSCTPTHTHSHVRTHVCRPHSTLSHLLSAAPSLPVPRHVPDPTGHQHPTRGHALQKSPWAAQLGMGTG